jgi:hypothetical protein
MKSLTSLSIGHTTHRLLAETGRVAIVVAAVIVLGAMLTWAQRAPAHDVTAQPSARAADPRYLAIKDAQLDRLALTHAPAAAGAAVPARERYETLKLEQSERIAASASMSRVAPAAAQQRYSDLKDRQAEMVDRTFTGVTHSALPGARERYEQLKDRKSQ